MAQFAMSGPYDTESSIQLCCTWGAVRGPEILMIVWNHVYWFPANHHDGSSFSQFHYVKRKKRAVLEFRRTEQVSGHHPRARKSCKRISEFVGSRTSIIMSRSKSVTLVLVGKRPITCPQRIAPISACRLLETKLTHDWRQFYQGLLKGVSLHRRASPD